jgi:hypothetical protein
VAALLLLLLLCLGLHKVEADSSGSSNSTQVCAESSTLSALAVHATTNFLLTWQQAFITCPPAV